MRGIELDRPQQAGVEKRAVLIEEFPRAERDPPGRWARRFVDHPVRNDRQAAADRLWLIAVGPANDMRPSAVIRFLLITNHSVRPVVRHLDLELVFACAEEARYVHLEWWFPQNSEIASVQNHFGSTFDLTQIQPRHFGGIHHFGGDRENFLVGRDSRVKFHPGDLMLAQGMQLGQTHGFRGSQTGFKTDLPVLIQRQGCSCSIDIDSVGLARSPLQIVGARFPDSQGCFSPGAGCHLVVNIPGKRDPLGDL